MKSNADDISKYSCSKCAFFHSERVKIALWIISTAETLRRRSEKDTTNTHGSIYTINRGGTRDEEVENIYDFMQYVINFAI